VVTSDTKPGLQPFGFAGGLCDDDTGLVRFEARDGMHLAPLGRHTQHLLGRAAEEITSVTRALPGASDTHPLESYAPLKSDNAPTSDAHPQVTPFSAALHPRAGRRGRTRRASLPHIRPAPHAPALRAFRARICRGPGRAQRRRREHDRPHLPAPHRGAAPDAQDRLLTDGTTTYTYTASGALATKTTGSDTTTYEYDPLGALKSVTLPDGTDIEYVLDATHRRIGKRVNGTLTRAYLYGNTLPNVRALTQPQSYPYDTVVPLLAELDGSGNLVSRFVYGTHINVPDYMIRGGTTYRLVTDERGSVRLVVNATTGEVAQRIDYDAWGVVTDDTNPGLQPFGFAGGLYDENTGLVRFGARDYDASIGRWVSKDPSLFRGGANLHIYAKDNPTSFVDLDGRNPVVVGTVVGALYGAFYHAMTAPTDLCAGDFLKGFVGAVASGAFAGGVGAAVEGGLLVDIVANAAISLASQGLEAAISGETPGLNETLAKAAISGASSGIGGAIAAHLLPGGPLPTVVESSLIAGPVADVTFWLLKEHSQQGYF
jgi:RHS repeat-associated protein